MLCLITSFSFVLDSVEHHGIFDKETLRHALPCSGPFVVAFAQEGHQASCIASVGLNQSQVAKSPFEGPRFPVQDFSRDEQTDTASLEMSCMQADRLWCPRFWREMWAVLATVCRPNLCCSTTKAQRFDSPPGEMELQSPMAGISTRKLPRKPKPHPEPIRKTMRFLVLPHAMP